MTRPNSPCYDCPNRKVRCASACPDWQEYVQLRDQFYRAKHTEDEYVEYITKSISRSKKHKRR